MAESAPLHTVRLGQGTPQVAYLHGLFGQGRNWHAVAKAVQAKVGGSALLIDLPDHGRSPWTDTDQPIHLADYAAAVAAQLARASPAPWMLVGHSLGGKVAMQLALRWPQALAQVVIVDIAPKSYGGLSQFGTYLSTMRSMPLGQLESRADADNWLARVEPNAGVRSFLLQNLQRATRAELAAGAAPWRWQANLTGIARDLLRGDASQIASWTDSGRACEVGAWSPYGGAATLIRGERSDYVLEEDLPRLRALFPALRVVSVKGAAHWVHTDAPDVVIAVLCSLVSQR